MSRNAENQKQLKDTAVVYQPPQQPQQDVPPPPYTAFQPPPPAQPIGGYAYPPQPPAHAIQYSTPVVAQPPSHNNAVYPAYQPNNPNDMSVLIGDRIIYDFEKTSCCPGQAVGLEPQVKDNVHPLLVEKGVTAEQWHQWMSELDQVQKKAGSVAGCLCTVCFPFGVIQTMLCVMCCPLSMDHALSWLPCCYGDWYEALRRWTDKVNETLRTMGMHAQLVTYKPCSLAPRSKFYARRIAGKGRDYEMSFLVIALTPTESATLEQEGWDHGVHDGCMSGRGRSL